MVKLRLRLTRLLSKQQEAEKDQWAELEKTHNVKQARAVITQQSEIKAADSAQVKARILRRYELPISLKLVLHERAAAPGREGERCCMLEVSDTIRLPELQQLIDERFAARFPAQCRGQRLRPMWLRDSGETVPIDTQRALHAWLDDKWCTHPVLLHLLNDATATCEALDLADQASTVFEQYDEDGSGTIDAAELTGLLQGLLRHSSVEDVPGLNERMVEHFVEAEFAQADKDRSGELDFDEFCRFFNKLGDWARLQLVATNQHVQVYKRISEHYLEAAMTPAPLARSAITSYQGLGGSLMARKYGLRLDVPPGALQGTHIDSRDDEQHGPQARPRRRTTLVACLARGRPPPSPAPRPPSHHQQAPPPRRPPARPRRASRSRRRCRTASSTSSMPRPRRRTATSRSAPPSA